MDIGTVGISMQDSIRQTLSYFYKATKIPVSYYKKTGLEYAFVPTVFEPDIAFCYLINAIDFHKKIGFGVHGNVYVGYVALPEEEYILIGPVSEQKVSHGQCIEILNELSIKRSKAAELEYFLKKVPVMSRARFLSTLQFLDFILNQEENDIEDVSGSEIVKSVDISAELEADNENFQEKHDTEEVEKMLIAAVAAGKDRELIGIMTKLTAATLTAGRTAATSLRTAKNVFISSTAIISRVAVQAGLDYDLALTISDLYIQKIETMNTLEPIIVMLGTMMADYCNRIKKIRKYDGESMIVIKATEYVRRNIYKKLQVKDVADSLGLSISYVSAVFKKETGVSLKQYIQEEKISEAKYLLSKPGASIPDVAERLSYSSVSHFQSAFRKATGTTPGMFKNLVRKAGTVPETVGKTVEK